MILKDPDFEDLTSTINLIGETITEHGFGDRLLAAVFRIDYEEKKPTGSITSSGVTSIRMVVSKETMPQRCG